MYVQVEWSVEFHLCMLWHQTAFSISLVEHIEQFMVSGVSLQECESVLAHNGLYFQKKKHAEIACYRGDSPSTMHSTSIDEVISISLQKQSPSRNALRGCFLCRYTKWKEVYDYQMKVRSIPHDNLWQSCDHTFHTIANVGLFREEDGYWTKDCFVF